MIHQLLLVASLLACALIAVDALRSIGGSRRRLAVTASAASCALWVLGELLVLRAAGPAEVTFARRILFAGTCYLGVAVLWTTAEAARVRWVSERPALLIPPLAVATGIYSFLYWDRSGLFVHWTAVPPVHGPMFAFHVAVLWIELGIGTVQLGLAAKRMRDKRRMVLMPALVALLIALAVNADYLIRGSGSLDPTPILLGPVAWLLRLGVLDASFGPLSPLSRYSWLNQLPCGVLIVDQAGEVVSANTRAQEFAGDATLVGQMIEPAIQAMRRNGERVLDVSSSRLNTPLGESGAIYSFIDRTEAERLARHLAQARKAEDLNLWVGGTTSELSNALMVSIERTHQALESGRSDAQRQDALKAALQATSRMQSFLQRISALASGVRSAPSLVDPNATVRSILEQRYVLETESSCALRGEMSPERPRVALDAHHLQQIVVHLVQNAQESGAREIVIATGRRVVTPEIAEEARPLGMVSQGSAFAITVSDDGEGMDGETLERAFDPFFSTRAGRQGLGLSVALGLAVREGLALHVASSRASGTTVSVLFPTTAATFGPRPSESKPKTVRVRECTKS